ncbi:MAG: hypothetical protein KF861_13740 [Planctomycetaceae bacterium]|nr:hypothetical protein [Planctomycetaceae bacterium]
MSDDLSINPEPVDSVDDEFEEISSDEVDRVCAVLDELIETVHSENIQAYLEECSNNIFSLVYDSGDFESARDEAA